MVRQATSDGVSDAGPSDPDLLARIDAGAFARFAATVWGVDPASVRFVEQSANAIFCGERDGAGMFFRAVHEQRTRDAGNLVSVQE